MSDRVKRAITDKPRVAFSVQDVAGAAQIGDRIVHHPHTHGCDLIN